MGLTMYCNVPYHSNVSYRTVAYRIVLHRTAPVLNCIVSCRVVLFRIVLYKYFQSNKQKKHNLIPVIYNVAELGLNFNKGPLAAIYSCRLWGRNCLKKFELKNKICLPIQRVCVIVLHILCYFLTKFKKVFQFTSCVGDTFVLYCACLSRSAWWSAKWSSCHGYLSW